MHSRSSRITSFMLTGVALVLGLFAQPSTAQVSAPRAEPDTTCAAKCQREYDGNVSAADAMLKAKKYSLNGWCMTPWNTTVNACAVAFRTCDAPCGIYNDSCKQPCWAALQTCCHANEVANAEHDRDLCLNGCPRSNPLATALSSRVTPWKDKIDAWEALQSRKSAAERASEDKRRQEVLDEAQARLRSMKGSFAILSGGGGRLWVIRPDGAPMRMPNALAALLRGGSFESDEKANPSGEGWPAQVNQTQVSSEHSSVRGTINGGGDFI